MVLNKRIPRVLRAHKAQYLGAAFLVMLSCLLFTLMYAMADNLQNSLHAFVQNHHIEDVKAMTQHPIDDKATLEAQDHVRIEERREFDTTWQDATLRVFDRSEWINTPAIVNGSDLHADDDILLSPPFATAHHVQVGDQITLNDRSYHVRGFFSLPDYIYALHSENDLLTDPNSFGLAIVTKSEMSRLHEGHSFLMIHYEGTPTPKLKQDLQASYGLLYWKERDQNPRYQLAVNKIQQTHDLAVKLPIAILLLTCLLLATTMWRMIKMEFSLIGTLYALGYRKGEILRHYLHYPVLLSLVGALVGVGGALMILPSFYNVLGTYFNIPMTTTSPGVVNVITAFVIPLLFLVPTVAWVVWRALRLKPVDLMKGSPPSPKFRSRLRRFEWNSLSFPMKFRLREWTRNGSKSLLMFFGVLLSTVFLLFGFVTQSSVSSLLTDGFGNTYLYQYDTTFTTLQTKAPSVGDVYNAAPFHASLSNSQDTSRSSIDGQKPKPFLLYGLQPSSKLIALQDQNGQDLSLSQTIITQSLADTLQVQAGDTLSIISEWMDRRYTLKIDAVAHVYTGRAIYVPLSTLNRMLDLPTDSYIGVYSLEKLPADKSHLLKVTSRDEQKRAFAAALEPMKYTLFLTGGVSFLIALIVLHLITSLRIEEGRGTISMLKVLGYRSKEIETLLLSAGLVPVVLGYLAGIPLTLLSLDQLLQSASKGMDLTLPVRVNPWYVALGFLILYGTYELSKFLAKKKVSAVSMAESLKMQRE